MNVISPQTRRIGALQQARIFIVALWLVFPKAVSLEREYSYRLTLGYICKRDAALPTFGPPPVAPELDSLKHV